MISYWLEYNETKGGWSKHARHRPRPRAVCFKGPLTMGHKTVKAQGRVKRMITIFDDRTTPPTLVREDYSLHDLKLLGAKLPEAYLDQQGNMHREGGVTVLRVED